MAAFEYVHIKLSNVCFCFLNVCLHTGIILNPASMLDDSIETHGSYLELMKL